MTNEGCWFRIYITILLMTLSSADFKMDQLFILNVLLMFYGTQAIYLFSEPKVAVIGQNLTLTCSTTRNISTLLWYRNGTLLGCTFNYKTCEINTPPGYQCGSHKTHQIIIRNPKYEDGVTWRCQKNKNYSDYTVHLSTNKATSTRIQTTQSQTPSNYVTVTSDRFAEGIGIGFIIGGVVATIATTVIVCLRLRRMKSKSVRDTNMIENRPNHYDGLENREPPAVSKYQQLKLYEEPVIPGSQPQISHVRDTNMKIGPTITKA